MKDNIKYIPMGLFCLYILKAMVFGLSLPELGTLTVLGAFAALYERSSIYNFEKETKETLYKFTKRFEDTDKNTLILLENDKIFNTELQKLKLPQTMKNSPFGVMR